MAFDANLGCLIFILITGFINAYDLKSMSYKGKVDDESREKIAVSIADTETGNECSYFAGARFSSRQSSLINCTWFADDACCKRTEVTSVFGGMPPLYLASTNCKNMINYLMCFFCSPQQKIWYIKNQARICSQYCTEIYQNCKTAYGNGKLIGKMFKSGKEFCEDQNFIVVEGENNCYNFDPTVFGTSCRLQSYCTFCLIAVIASITLNSLAGNL